MSFPRVLPVGDAAATLELGDTLDPATNARVRAVDAALAREPFDGFVESVPTHRSLLVLHDPGLPFASVARELLARLGRHAAPPAAPRLHEVPTVYGGEHGPDLGALARAAGVDELELARRHAAVEYTAFMLGFTPGFAYLGVLPQELAAARHATPRVRVPAGSVAIAGRLTGIYPSPSPGGWQIIGRCGLRVFDPWRSEPALFAPGDRVRFRPVAELPVEAAEPRRAATAERAGDLEVLQPGLLATVQDSGRLGWRRLGVAGAGAADRASLARANEALGNEAGAAALECTLTGPELRFRRALRFAVCGADLGAVLVRGDLGAWPVPSGAAVLARPGNVLRFTGRRTGCRAVIAFEGGLDVPVVLGSRSTDLAAAFGGADGRALAGGDRLACLPRQRSTLADGARAAAALPATRTSARVVLGPQAAHFDPATLRAFLSEPWRVSARSDRVGCRLEGPRLRHRGAAEILSDGMVPGCVQVPPDGQPIVMLADAPTTGGYPKIATVVSADLPQVAQLVPGEGELRFEAIRVEDA